MMNHEEFVEGYCWAIFFTESFEGYFEPGADITEQFNTEEMLEHFSHTLMDEIREDCEDFIQNNLSKLLTFKEKTGTTDSRLGELFWYSRNGHGTGFFEYGLAGKILQDAAKIYGSFYLERRMYFDKENK